MLGFLLHSKDQLSVGGASIFSNCQLSVMLGLQENGELLQKSRDHHGICLMNKESVCVYGDTIDLENLW